MKLKVKLTLLSAALVAGIGLWAGVMLTAAQENKNTEKSKKSDGEQETVAELEKKALNPSNLASQIQWFRKPIDKDDKTADAGNRIVAIRRINFIYEERDEKKLTVEKRKPMIEIEVYSKVHIPVTNNFHCANIGNKSTTNVPGSANGHTFFIELTPEEFAKLKDDAAISYTIGSCSTLIGAKFGTLDKKLIEQFDVIEEDGQAQWQRRGKSEN